MPTIKDALDIIGKLTVAEQESLKTMLLSPAFVKSLNIEDFVAKERFANGRVCPLCGCIHVVRNGHRKDGTQRYVCKDCGKSFRDCYELHLCLVQEKTCPCGSSTLIV